MTELVQPVILCDGSGTRLWPLSRAGFPKQFLCLTGDESLFQQAVKRLVGLGSAEITCGDKKLLLTENQPTYIPLGEVHRLANPSTIPLEIIEVQSGSYMGEDHYGRSEK